MKLQVLPIEKSKILILRKERELASLFAARQVFVRKMVTDLVNNRINNKASLSAPQLKDPPYELAPNYQHLSDRDKSGKFVKGSRTNTKRKKGRRPQDPIYTNRTSGPNLTPGVSFNTGIPYPSEVAPGGVPSNLQLQSEILQQVYNKAKANGATSPITGKLIKEFRKERGTARPRSPDNPLTKQLGIGVLSANQMNAPNRPESTQSKIEHLRNLMLDVLSSNMPNGLELTKDVLLRLANDKPEAILQLLKTLMPKETHVKEEKVPSPIVFDFDRLNNNNVRSN